MIAGGAGFAVVRERVMGPPVEHQRSRAVVPSALDPPEAQRLLADLGQPAKVGIDGDAEDERRARVGIVADLDTLVNPIGRGSLAVC